MPSGIINHTAQALMLVIGLIAVAALWSRMPWICRVSRVVDGDSLEIVRRGRVVRVRLRAMDAPEWTQPGGREAATALKRLIGGSKVLIAPVAFDVYGREVCHVMTRSGPASLSMLMGGHAWARTFTGHFASGFARIAGRGLWAQPGAVDPKYWRQSRPSRAGR